MKALCCLPHVRDGLIIEADPSASLEATYEQIGRTPRGIQNSSFAQTVTPRRTTRKIETHQPMHSDHTFVVKRAVFSLKTLSFLQWRVKG